MMLFALAGAITAAGSSIWEKMNNSKDPFSGGVILGILCAYLVAVAVGFVVHRETDKRIRAASKNN